MIFSSFVKIDLMSITYNSKSIELKNYFQDTKKLQFSIDFRNMLTKEKF